MVYKLKTSKETMLIFEEIGAKTHLQPFALSKLAIAISLRNHDKLTPEQFLINNEGLELNRQTITGEYDDLFKALIINHTQEPLSDEDYFPKYLKAHLDRGATLLYSEFKYSRGDFYKHLINIDKGL